MTNYQLFIENAGKSILTTIERIPFREKAGFIDAEKGRVIKWQLPSRS